jgi:prevent-host-death family protein
MNKWQMQQVKQRLSEVVHLSKTDGPQMITHRGLPFAWIISDEDYHKFAEPKENIVDFFQRSPHRDIELPIERRKDPSRDINL